MRHGKASEYWQGILETHGPRGKTKFWSLVLCLQEQPLGDRLSVKDMEGARGKGEGRKEREWEGVRAVPRGRSGRAYDGGRGAGWPGFASLVTALITTG